LVKLKGGFGQKTIEKETMGFKGKCQKNFSTDRELEIGSPESLRFNVRALTQAGNSCAVSLVANAH